ncbi:MULTISPECIES: ABC transporter permease [unclassified Curtobacterium]|uniref:ABC transporter permease n=1 Tax=unclassified Curtobacterium TaxID=257496 RepID=UPI0008DDD4DD|nr:MULTISPECIES: ABC transporter permease [unclassified Curtobacterium]OIH96916.1 peptide ABC transporter permease [Curtobacterium sp. MCBA15_003]OII09413.1 peptide ABC transporter permease [Curtobacterium sp. MCBA15_009]OII31103.1 peptide ABC transporter permease [Curtobacterium sp. MMLR14_006]
MTTAALSATVEPVVAGRRRPLLAVVRTPGFWLPAGVLAVVLLVAAFPQLLAGLFGHGDPRACDLGRSGDAPTDGHPFGFDLQGCDVYANVVHGTRSSVAVAVLTTVLAGVVAVVVGTVAGMVGGWVDAALARLTDVFLGFPFLLGAVVVLNSVGERSVLTVSLVLALFGWPTMARLVRSSVRSVRNAEFVLAARTMGLSTWRITTRYVLPSSVSPLLVLATITVGGVIVSESTLTYLGIGLERPAVSWGLQLSAATSQFLRAPHMLVAPAAFLAVTVLAVIALGDTLRAALDPRRR